MKNSRETVNGAQIASPCHMAWSQMEGDNRKRFCLSCRRHVFNISEMDVEEAAKLISDSTERICIRLYRRTDGTVMTRDCPVGVRAVIRRKVAVTAGSIAMGVGVLSSLLLRPDHRPLKPRTLPNQKSVGVRQPFRSIKKDTGPRVKRSNPFMANGELTSVIVPGEAPMGLIELPVAHKVEADQRSR